MRSWMMKLCADRDSLWNERQGWMAGVRKVATRTGVWSVATNGYRLLALRDNGDEAERQAGQSADARRIPETIVAFIDRPLIEPKRFDLSDLRLWLGPRLVEKCPSCKGYDGCQHCDGDGWVEPIRQPVVLWNRPEHGGYFDPQLLSAALPKPLGGGPVAAGWSLRPTVAAPTVGFDGERDGVRWRAVVVGLDMERSSRQREMLDAPVYSPGIGAVWHLRDPDAGLRGIFLDWCLDHGVDPVEADPANRYAGMVCEVVK